MEVVDVLLGVEQSSAREAAAVVGPERGALSLCGDELCRAGGLDGVEFEVNVAAARLGVVVVCVASVLEDVAVVALEEVWPAVPVTDDSAWTTGNAAKLPEKK